jgi:hypothetical protein
VLVVARFSVEPAEEERFADRARLALDALGGCPGYRRGSLGRAVDDPASWLLLTEWDGVGAYRRALSAYRVRVEAVPLLATAQTGPGAYEVLLTVGGGAAEVGRSDRAPDADTAAPGRPIPPLAADRTGQESA